MHIRLFVVVADLPRNTPCKVNGHQEFNRNQADNENHGQNQFDLRGNATIRVHIKRGNTSKLLEAVQVSRHIVAHSFRRNIVSSPLLFRIIIFQLLQEGSELGI